MADEFLQVYLNDHFAGAQMAMEILALLRKIDPSGRWPQLEQEISEDRGELEQLIKKSGSTPSSVRRAAAWMSEKLAELKMYVDDRSSDGTLRRLELIEALALGIDGKQALWTALQRAADGNPKLASVDYPRLIARAEAQRRTVEVARLIAATEALHHG